MLLVIRVILPANSDSGRGGSGSGGLRGIRKDPPGRPKAALQDCRRTIHALARAVPMQDHEVGAHSTGCLHPPAVPLEGRDFGQIASASYR